MTSSASRRAPVSTFDGKSGHETAPMPWMGLFARRTTALASCEGECHADRLGSRYADFLRPQTERDLWITCHQNQKGPKLSLRPRSHQRARESLDHLQMAGARLATLGDEFVADLLRFIEGRQTSALDGADMNEHVLRTVIRLDKAEALLRIEPLNFACRHIGNLSSCEQTGGLSLVPVFEPQCLENSPKGSNAKQGRRSNAA
jgi:hypothetical protein